MAENGDKSKKILDGIQLTLQEIRDLKVEFLEHSRKADADRKRADERFEYLIKRSDEDRQRADEDRRRSDERFDRLMRGVVNVGRRIIRTQEEHTRLLREHGKALHGILRALLAGRNGAGGNGSHKPA